jgi:hypothetical protein
MKNIDFFKAQQEIEMQGFAIVDDVLTSKQAQSLIDLYPERDQFFSRVNMRRWKDDATNAEYKYLGAKDPFNERHVILPPYIQQIREALYEGLVDLANNWIAAINYFNDMHHPSYPDKYDDFIAMSEEAGLTHPFVAVLAYEQGEGNAVHQDQESLDIKFPFQMAVLLNDEDEFSGGRFIIQGENKEPVCVELKKRQGVIFPSSYHVVNTDEDIRVEKAMHGVEPLVSNTDSQYCRWTLGVGCHQQRPPRRRPH